MAKRDVPKPLLDRAILLLVSGLTEDRVRSELAKAGADRRRTARIIREAVKRVSQCAEANREAELGKAIMRTQDCYAHAVAEKDWKTALAAQKELTRMLRLHEANHDDGPNPEVEFLQHRLDQVASYLLPLELADPAYPVEEHARIAAQRLTEHNDDDADVADRPGLRSAEAPAGT